MTRLELIMTTDHAPALTPEQARLLLSDHLEGALDDDVRRQIDALLVQHPALAAERRRVAQTLRLLKGLPVPEAPTDMVGRVRDRLAAERRASAVGEAAPRPTRRLGALEAALGLAAAASVAVFIAVANRPAGDGASDGTAAAGISDGSSAVSTTIVAPGISAERVRELAVKAGMDTILPSSPANVSTYEGDRRAAARFLLSLKVVAAERGVEVSGFLPDADRLRIEVRSE